MKGTPADGARSLKGAPTKAVHSFCGERSHSGARELSGKPGSEGCGACGDEVEEARAGLYREQARKLREETSSRPAEQPPAQNKN